MARRIIIAGKDRTARIMSGKATTGPSICMAVVIVRTIIMIRPYCLKTWPKSSDRVDWVSFGGVKLPLAVAVRTAYEYFIKHPQINMLVKVLKRDFPEKIVAAITRNTFRIKGLGEKG